MIQKKSDYVHRAHTGNMSYVCVSVLIYFSVINRRTSPSSHAYIIKSSLHFKTRHIHTHDQLIDSNVSEYSHKRLIRCHSHSVTYSPIKVVRLTWWKYFSAIQFVKYLRKCLIEHHNMKVFSLNDLYNLTPCRVFYI